MFGATAHNNMTIMAKNPPKLAKEHEEHLLKDLRVKLGPYADSNRLLYHIRITRGKLHWSVNSYFRDVMAEGTVPGTPYDFQPKQSQRQVQQTAQGGNAALSQHQAELFTSHRASTQPSPELQSRSEAQQQQVPALAAQPASQADQTHASVTAHASSSHVCSCPSSDLQHPFSAPAALMEANTDASMANQHDVPKLGADAEVGVGTDTLGLGPPGAGDRHATLWPSSSDNQGLHAHTSCDLKPSGGVSCGSMERGTCPNGLNSNSSNGMHTDANVNGPSSLNSTSTNDINSSMGTPTPCPSSFAGANSLSGLCRYKSSHQGVAASVVTNGFLSSCPSSVSCSSKGKSNTARKGLDDGLHGGSQSCVKRGFLGGGCCEGGSSKGHLGALPTEVLEDVLSHCMDPATLCSAACASRAMHEAATSDVVWKKLFISRWGNTRFPLKPSTPAALPSWATNTGFAVAMGLGEPGLAQHTQQPQGVQQALQQPQQPLQPHQEHLQQQQQLPVHPHQEHQVHGVLPGQDMQQQQEPRQHFVQGMPNQDLQLQQAQSQALYMQQQHWASKESPIAYTPSTSCLVVPVHSASAAMPPPPITREHAPSSVMLPPPSIREPAAPSEHSQTTSRPAAAPIQATAPLTSFYPGHPEPSSRNCGPTTATHASTSPGPCEVLESGSRTQPAIISCASTSNTPTPATQQGYGCVSNVAVGFTAGTQSGIEAVSNVGLSTGAQSGIEAVSSGVPSGLSMAMQPEITLFPSAGCTSGPTQGACKRAEQVPWVQAYKEQASYVALSCCPICGSGKLVPIVYGYPSSKLLEGMRLFQLILGGDHLIEDCHCWACCGCNASFRSYPYEKTHLWQQEIRAQRDHAAASQSNYDSPNTLHLPMYTYEL